MSWRGTITYWLLAAVLGGYYLVIERRPEPRSEMQLSRRKVLDVFGEDIAAVTLHREGKSIRCERREKRWEIVKPAGAKVPSDLIAALVENITEKQEAEEIAVAPSADDLQAFGLGDASPTLEVELGGGKKVSVKFGSRNPTQTALYAETSVSPHVLLIGVNIQYYVDLLYEAGTQAAKAVAAK